MWPVIRKYYLAFFLVFVLIFSIQSLVAKSSNPFAKNALLVVAGALLISLLCGTFYFLYDTRWGPRKREKRFLKSPFKELFENGFIRKENFALGKINGYTTVVMYTWDEGKSAIKVDALFDLSTSTGLNGEDMIKEISKRNPPANKFFDQPYIWTKNSIGYRLEYNFSPPSYKELMEKTEKLTAVLIRERLATMSIEEAMKLQDAV
jgi:hypothetical protein